MTKLNRRAAVRQLLHERGDLIVVAGLGAPAYDVAACGDEPLDFPLWGAMGASAMVGLGLALSQPGRKVLVITGDGEMLMGLGGLATIAIQNPENLRIIVLDNECFGETGRQKTHTGMGLNLASVARACGIQNVRTVQTDEQVEPLRREIQTGTGLLFAVLQVSVDDHPKVLPPRDGPYLTYRMRKELLGEKKALNG